MAPKAWVKSCIIPTAPAITNAIHNATGVRVDCLPVDQEKVLWGLK